MSQAVLLARYPKGVPTPADFALAEVPTPEPADGEVLVEVTHLSMDPLPRVRMAERSPIGPPMRLGHPVEGRATGRVLASRAPAFRPGDPVIGELGWRTHAVLPAAALQPAAETPLHANLNTLGPTGLAAYFCVESVAPQPADTMLIAPGAGAVGLLAAGIARLLAPGVRILATARGPGQRAHLEAHGLEPVDPDTPPQTPIDILIDGVGGAFHDHAVRHLKPHARVLLLGFVSAYNSGGPPRYGDAAAILMRRATMRGFLLADHAAAFPRALAHLRTWVESGRLTPAETLWPGLAQAPHAFAALFGDAPPGKQIIALET